MTKEEWIAEAAFHFKRMAGLDAERARECAEAAYENLDLGHDELTPLDAVDEELSCWTD